MENDLIQKDISFDNVGENGQVFQVFPTVFGDPRGFFTEVYRSTMPLPSDAPSIAKRGLSWIRQINRSCSSSFVMRGMHAQVGYGCQAKLVEAINRDIFDIIIDARPDSSSFGVTKIFLLSSKLQNKLFVPHGFLHGFIVPGGSDEKAYFNYYCDRCYSKDEEIGVSPLSFLTDAKDNINKAIHGNNDFNGLVQLLSDTTSLTFSNKDISALNYVAFMRSVERLYNEKDVLWYANTCSVKDIMDIYEDEKMRL